MSLEGRINNLLGDAQVIATICNQWGDSGKGKIADLIAAYWSDVDIRCTGGHNAGHSFYIEGKEVIFHLLPIGVVYEKERPEKISILGSGMVIDLEALCKELDWMDKVGRPYNNLMISQDAHIIMPYHKVEDKKQATQKEGRIGTTGRGIGPCYTDRTARRGVTVNDLFDKDLLVRKITNIKPYYSDQKINVEEIIEKLQPYINRIKNFVTNTDAEIETLLRQGKKIQLEGAQGLLLSKNHGTYPYVTSSDCSINGTSSGAGLSAKLVDIVLGLVKYPMMTRVGAGAFPTELGGKKSEEYCAEGLKHDIFYEVKEYLGMPLDIDNIRKLRAEKKEDELLQAKFEVYDYIKAHRDDVVRLINKPDPFIKGVGVRLAANEYGATTSRPRRTGWTDGVAARYAARINGPLFILTKLDALAGCDEFSICDGYMVKGKIHTQFNRQDCFLRMVEPRLKSFKGYSDIRGIIKFDELPSALRESIDYFEKFTGGRVVMLSNGPEREQIIIRGLK